MSKAKLKKHLSALSKEQVVDIMLQLYDASKEASSWLEFYMEPIAMLNLKNTKRQSPDFVNAYPKNYLRKEVRCVDDVS